MSEWGARRVPFRPNEQMEGLLELREQRPAEFAAMPPRAKIAAGLYERDRAAAEQTRTPDEG